MTVAMELAVATHHSSPKGGWSGVTHNALRGQTTASSGGRRPGVLKEPEPPNVVERVQRHILEQTVSAPGLQILDAPVPQMVDIVLEFFRALDPPVAEQVIAVPKISTDRVSQRPGGAASPSDGGTVGARADTVLSPLLIAEQIVGIPAPQRGGNWSLHGPLPGQSSTLSPSPKTHF